MYGYIYKITNKINNKVYIGKTIYTIEKRFKEHIKDSTKRDKENRPLYRAMNKYGVENFVIQMVEKVPFTNGGKELEEREVYWISKYDSYNTGYNATIGGDGTVLYDYEMIKELYLELKSISKTAKMLSCDPKTVRNVLDKLGISRKEIRNNQAYTLGKPIIQFDKENNELRKFDSLISACRWISSEGITNTKPESITSHVIENIKGKRKSAYGYIWTYA